MLRIWAFQSAEYTVQYTRFSADFHPNPLTLRDIPEFRPERGSAPVGSGVDSGVGSPGDSPVGSGVGSPPHSGVGSVGDSPGDSPLGSPPHSGVGSGVGSPPGSGGDSPGGSPPGSPLGSGVGSLPPCGVVNRIRSLILQSVICNLKSAIALRWAPHWALGSSIGFCNRLAPRSPRHSGVCSCTPGRNAEGLDLTPLTCAWLKAATSLVSASVTGT